MVQQDTGVIHTKRLVLRCTQTSDAEWMAQEIANPKVQCWLTAPPNPYRVQDAKDYIATRSGDPGFRVICLNDAPIGVVSFTRADGDFPDLGYWLAEASWNNGYMSEAAGALLDWHFARHNEPVYSGWIKGNAASANVLTKLGFQATEAIKGWSNFHGRDMPMERVRLDPPSYKRMFELRTERLIFDALTVSDAAVVAAEWGRPEVARMTATMKTGWSEAEARAWILQRGPQSPNGFGFAIRRATDLRLVGSIGMGDDPRDLGYVFGPDYWGQGYATEAIHSFLTSAYANFPHIDEIGAGVFEDNPASARVLQKIGFVRVGQEHYASVSRDRVSVSVQYSLTKTAFLGKRSDV